MSRHDGKLNAAGETVLAPTELLAALAARAKDSDRLRQDAMACGLSGGRGWKQALHRLGGAFAADVAMDKVKDG